MISRFFFFDHVTLERELEKFNKNLMYTGRGGQTFRTLLTDFYRHEIPLLPTSIYFGGYLTFPFCVYTSLRIR